MDPLVKSNIVPIATKVCLLKLEQMLCVEMTTGNGDTQRPHVEGLVFLALDIDAD
jgi:hypothetical protein